MPQIDEQENILEMEREMEEDPRYWLFTAVDKLEKANNILFHKGDNSTRDVVLEALNRTKHALKLMENK